MANSNVLYTLLSILVLILVGFASSHPTDSHLHSTTRSVSDYADNKRWYHPRDHPVAALFIRDNSSAATVGSTQWTSMYPTPPLNLAKTPQAWLTAYNNVMQAGLIPNVSVSKMGSDGNPAYPNGQNPNSAAICSFTYGCNVTSDLFNAPDGMIGISFDDGPLPTSPPLYDFLKSQGQKATHFFIGSNIHDNPQVFMQAYQDLEDDVAVHTYTHPYMTTLSNENVVAELGWTMQIIHDSTGGKLPRFWRPPYGDTDNRVRAIAKQVFGLTCVVWNQDSQDWQLSEPGTKYTPASVNKSLVGWITGPKSPGLVILEHELSNMSVQAFINVYPLMKSQGWDTRAIPDTFGTSYYLNAVNSTTDVTQAMDVAQAGVASLPSTIGSSPSSVDGPPQSTGSKMSSPSAPVNAEKNKNSAPSRSASPLLLLIPGLIALVVSLIQ